MDFIGIGAQKAGTSWTYACLYEHPEICAPIKEIHFFSRERFAKGQEWYESHVAACAPGLLRGEFSTSYLSSAVAAKRMQELYPAAKLIAILRNPVDRAFSQYRNAIKAGEISRRTSFAAYQEGESSVFSQGLYHEQLQRFLWYFPREQLHVAIYEDSLADPAGFIKQMYAFLGVDTDFQPSLLTRSVNVSRTPRLVTLDRLTHAMAEWLRRVGLDKLVWLVKKSGLTDVVRSLNTRADNMTLSAVERAELAAYFKDDVAALSSLLQRDLSTEWNIR